MDSIIAAYMMSSAAVLTPHADKPVVKPAPVVINLKPVPGNWCTKGYLVMVPDGRQGVVTSVSGEICRVRADGEEFVTPIPYYIVEPYYPQPFKTAEVGH